MQNFLFTVNAVLPLFVIIGVGWLCRRAELLDESNISMINRLSFRVLFPCIGFSSAYSAQLTLSSLGLIGYQLAIYLVAFFLLLWAVPHFVADRKQACVVTHASFRSNIVLFGVSMAYNLFGAEGAGPAVLSVALMVPFTNLCSVLLLKLYSGEAQQRLDLREVLRSVLTHPLILAALLGIFCSAMQVQLPTLVIKPIRDLAGAAAPLAMLALGARLRFQSAAAHWRLLAACCSIKLVILPLFALSVGWMIGFRQYELGAVFINFAMPAASNVAIMADSEGGDAVLAGEMVVFSSALSCFTLFIWVFSMKFFGLF